MLVVHGIAHPRQLDPKTQTTGGTLCKARSGVVLASAATTGPHQMQLGIDAAKQRPIDPF